MSDIFRDYSFGGWLKSFRVEAKLTLREAARTLDMDAGNYCKLERSEIDPPKNRASIERLLKALNAEKHLDFMVSLAFQHHLACLRERFK